MNYFNNAIKLAIEKGGYKGLIKFADYGEELKNKAVLDPLFWQALGKALGWEEKVNRIDTYSEVWEWKYQAHQYLHAKFNGTEEKFWKELISN